jgi:hypothetical protein
MVSRLGDDNPVRMRSLLVVAPILLSWDRGPPSLALSPSLMRKNLALLVQTGVESLIDGDDRFALPIGPFAGLAEIQEPGGPRCEARGERGLGTVI